MADDSNAGPSETSFRDSPRDSPAPASVATAKRSGRTAAHSRLRKWRIRKLEKKLELYHRQIKRVSEMEVSLDDMKSRSSAYLKEDWLKRRFLHAWEELCALVGVSPEVQMNDLVHERPYQGTSYPEVNRRVERLLQLGEFPDHYDVCQLVHRCNEKHSLGLRSEEVMHLSKMLFKEIGKILKQHRIKDLVQHMGCHLTDNLPEDPALSDPVLLQRLNENRRLSQKKLDDVCDTFVDKQECEGDSTASSSDNNQEEEEYSPHSDTERGLPRVDGHDDGLTDLGHCEGSNGVTNADDDNRHTGEHDEVENCHHDLHGSPGPWGPGEPQAGSGTEEHIASDDDSQHSQLNSGNHIVRQDLEEESDSATGSPLAKRMRLEVVETDYMESKKENSSVTDTPLAKSEPALPDSVKQHPPADASSSRHESSSSRQDDLVVISSEEDDVTKEMVIVVSD